MSKTIETDLKTFIKFWLVPIGIALMLFFINKASAGFIIIGASIFLALALRPLVRNVDHFIENLFKTKKQHHKTSVVFAYFLVIIIIGAILAIIGPVVVGQTANFIEQFPTAFEENFGGWDRVNEIAKNFGIENAQYGISSAIKNFSSYLINNFDSTILAGVGGIANAIFNIVLILILTLFFLLEGPDLHYKFWSKIKNRKQNPEYTKTAQNTIAKMANIVSTYVSRQIFIAVLDGIASMLIVFILTLIFNIPTSLAIPMGFTTAIFYLIPMFGQFIGGTLVTIVLLFSNPIAAIIFAVVYILYSQIENNVISPKIQGNALKLPVVIVLCSIILGVFTFGFLGAIIAVPIAGCIRILIDEYPALKTAKLLDKQKDNH